MHHHLLLLARGNNMQQLQQLHTGTQLLTTCEDNGCITTAYFVFMRSAVQRPYRRCHRYTCHYSRRSSRHDSVQQPNSIVGVVNGLLWCHYDWRHNAGITSRKRQCYAYTAVVQYRRSDGSGVGDSAEDVNDGVPINAA